jgi:hypothetical protein
MKSSKKRNDFEFAKKIWAIGLLCLLFTPLNGFAKTLAEYHRSLNSAREWTRNLDDYVHEVADNGSSASAEREREILSGIRTNLPSKEKIEWEGSSVETDNQWLETKLKAFEEEKKDWEKRRLMATEIGERLASIEAKIKQLESSTASNRSKDEDKRKLAEILRRPEYQKPEAEQESWFERVQKRIRDWFNQKFPQPEVPQGTEQGIQSFSFGLQILVYALALGFIAFLIYRFAPFFAGRFRRREKEEKGERVILGEKLAADEDAQTLFDEAEALARSGNLRGAIRKGYIALLCELSDRKVIGLAQHKTNRDYLRDVRKKQVLYQNMNGLTTSFERHWYGFETADEADWQEFKQNYRQAITSEQ